MNKQWKDIDYGSTLSFAPYGEFCGDAELGAVFKIEGRNWCFHDYMQCEFEELLHCNNMEDAKQKAERKIQTNFKNMIESYKYLLEEFQEE